MLTDDRFCAGGGLTPEASHRIQRDMSGCATSSSSSGDDEDEGRGRSKRARHDDAEGGPHAGRSPTRIKHEKKKKKDHKKKEYKHDKKAERKAAKDGEKLLRESSDGLMLKVGEMTSCRLDLPCSVI